DPAIRPRYNPPSADRRYSTDADAGPSSQRSRDHRDQRLGQSLGKQDRTTVAIGELSSFVVSDVEGGSWKSADGTGTTVNSVSFNWTASTAGTNAITYTAADKTTTSVTITTVVPSTLSGKKVSDLSYPAGTQGAGMNLTVTMSPTTVSFQALELMEGTCDASA